MLIVAVHLLLVASPVYIAAAAGPGWWTPALWLLFGLSMNGLLNLMHECAHILVFTKREWSDALGRRVLSPLVFADFDGYRERHWAHHKVLGRDGETKDTYLIDIRRSRLLLLFARCLLMIEAVSTFFKHAPRSTTGAGQRAWLLNVGVFQTLFAGSLLLTARSAHQSWQSSLVSAAVAYGVVYVYGLMSVTVLMASLRAIAEHQAVGHGSATSGYADLRNFSCNPFSRYLMGAYGFGEHYTHHRAPGIPYYNLQRATSQLSAAEQTLTPQSGYFSTLAKIVAGHAR